LIAAAARVLAARNVVVRENPDTFNLQIVRRHLVLVVAEPANLILEPGDLFAQFS
jgi:hypothetical protein